MEYKFTRQSTGSLEHNYDSSQIDISEHPLERILSKDNIDSRIKIQTKAGAVA